MRSISDAFLWQGSTLCDNSLEDYVVHAAAQRLERNRTDLLVGDWSATHFTCVCCPLVFRMLNPEAKIILMLRDPIQRALSRFLEQKSLAWAPLHQQVKNHTFATYVHQEMNTIDMCLARAVRYRGRQGGSNSPRPMLRGGAAVAVGVPGAESAAAAGWGAGMGLATWMEAQCYERSNILGWSVYDIFLENYMAHFPLNQILVLYTEELAADPLGMLRRVEGHLGLRPAAYNATLLATVFNSRGCYAWNCARQANEVRSAAELALAPDSPAGAQQSQQWQQSPFGRAVSRLIGFYRPHLQQLVRWGEQGVIAPLPPSWRTAYGV
ncbi:hypothetical protein GPECTOR_21g622 [Gonium pectorale]|uniref:Uncharacterized protein n=1 Tax=Gonium pectorale TaxID=33097 RepID=A0A150GHU0_GONPE|nr:hypothetical protein GPECTOR_21g622 [Gonium pectorale]|eukprot:KXZ49396.1 hypothetical protein GPECTOR_21g622 [Gonium pectorale]